MSWPIEMGSFTWDGASLIWAGGEPLDLEQAWGGTEIETDNHPQPGVDGSLPRDVFLTESQFAIRYHLSGFVLPDGSPAPNVAHGIAANYGHFLDLVGTPATWPTRKGVTAVVVRSDGVTLSGLAQGSVSRLGARVGSVGTCELRVTVPSGVLEVAGS